MMHVSITKSGFRPVKRDMDAGQPTGVEVGTYVSQLRSTCSIDPDVTLADIFAAVERDDPLTEFLRQYSWCDVPAFHAEARAPLTQPLNLPHLEYIEISKYLDFDDDHAEETVKVKGIGEPYADGRRRYGIDLTAVNELAPLPVRLHSMGEVRRDDKIIAQAPASFTLLEVLGEIYFEISFHGSPVQRDVLMADLREAAEEVNAHPCDKLAPSSSQEVL
jgi:hypothetical protein